MIGPASFNNTANQKAKAAKASDFPALECPHCQVLRKPKRLNKDDSVSYTCPADYKNHGNRYSWRINSDGSMVDAAARGVPF